MKRKGVYIPSINEKDICVAGYCGNEYSLKTKTGSVNLRKFINPLGYSLDLPTLSRTYWRVNDGADLYFEVNGKRYTQDVINVIFKYSVKEWNKVNKTTYMRCGYDAKKLNWLNCVAYSDGIVVGVHVNTLVQNGTIVRKDTSVQAAAGIEDTCFRYDKEEQMYKAPSSLPTIKSCAEIREDLYENGFICDGKKYVRFKRSAGSARIGECLFVTESLYKAMFEYASRGLDICETDSEVQNVHYIGKIDKNIYKCITEDIRTDEVIITDERIQHIKDRHPNDYERYCTYMREIIEKPEYIIEANKENSALILKSFVYGDEKFKTVLRLIASIENSDFKNSIITFMKIDEKEWKRLIKNKKILYKSE